MKHCREFVKGHHENVPVQLTPRLAVCRTPKVASLLIRSVAVAIATNQTFRPLSNKQYEEMKLATPESLISSTRLMFTRHPITRITAGWIQMQHTRDEPSFFKFISTILHKRYDPYCQKFEETTDGTYQHVLPAQHCRCGIPCGWNYTFYKIEERNIKAVLSRFVNKKQLPTQYVNRKIPSYMSKLLSHRVITFLNNMTVIEQDLLGYSKFMTEKYIYYNTFKS